MSSGLTTYPPSPPPDLTVLVDDDARVEAMVEWFHSNFEDPSESTPHDEGEFVYIWGGPYEAYDQLFDAFGGDASEELIARAVEEVQSNGIFDWAPSSNRVAPDDLEESPSDYEQMQARLADAKSILENLEPLSGPFGHNHPPPEAQMLALTAEDRDKILGAITYLQTAPASLPESEKEAAEKSAQVLDSYASKLGVWMKSNVVDEAGKAYGKTLGVAGAGATIAVMTALVGALAAAATAAFNWLASLPWNLIAPF